MRIPAGSLAAKGRIPCALRACIIIFICTHFFASVSAQHHIWIFADKEDIGTVLKKVESQSGFHYWMEEGVLEKALPVTVRLQNMPLIMALDSIFLGQPLTYKIVDRIIVVRLASSKPAGWTIEGTVMGNGEPLENASVWIKQTGKGVVTNQRGSFSIKNVPKGAVLVFSSVGYQSLERTITADSSLYVVLPPTEKQLDIPVVVAYGTSSQRYSTSHINTITGQQIGRQPVTNPLLALAGQLPGIYVQQTTGTTGGNVTVRVGGQNSIGSGNDPLYIIDGVPFPSTSLVQSGVIILQGSPFTFLSPQDIDGVTVMKDATATAIYGSRGANGVVIITTRKARQKQPLGLSVSSAFGWGKVTRRMKLLSTPEYLEMRHEAFKNDGQEPNPMKDFDLLSWDTTRFTDWQKELFGHTAVSWEQRLTVQGSGRNTAYLLSAGYQKESTVFGEDFFGKKGTIHGSFDYRSANGKANMALSFTGGLQQSKLPGEDPSTLALQLPPNAPEANLSDGSFNWAPGYQNPYAALAQIYKSTNKTMLIASRLSYKPIKGIRLFINGGITTASLTEFNPKPAHTINPAYGVKTGSSQFANSKIFSWTMEPQVEYTYNTGHWRIELLAGLTLHRSIGENKNLFASGYTDSSQLGSISNATNIQTVSDDVNDYRYIAGFGRSKFIFKNRYILELTARRDGSSRFGPDRQFASFGAAAVAWIFSEEAWIKNHLPFLAFGKISGSYGITGSDQIGNYQYQSTWAPARYLYAGQIALLPQRLLNRDLGWEQAQKLNIAFDGSLFAEKIQFSATYYHSTSSQQLLRYPLSAVTGFTTIVANAPVTSRNRSWEFTLTTRNFATPNFKWLTTLNVTLPESKLVSFPNIALTTYNYQYSVGKSLGLYKALQYNGIDPTKGIYTFDDIDKDNQITIPNDLSESKNLGQTAYGGFDNAIEFKKFQFDILVQFVNQAGINLIGTNTMTPGMQANQLSSVMSRWSKSGDISYVQKFTQNYDSEAYTSSLNFINSDAIIGNTSFIRIKSIAVSLDISDIFKKQGTWRPKTLFYLRAQNLLTITRYKGLDPETLSFIGFIPPLRIFNMGLVISY